MAASYENRNCNVGQVLGIATIVVDFAVCWRASYLVMCVVAGTAPAVTCYTPTRSNNNNDILHVCFALPALRVLSHFVDFMARARRAAKGEAGGHARTLPGKFVVKDKLAAAVMTCFGKTFSFR